MTKHFFTEEQVQILRQSKYVLSVTREVVKFSPEFKRLFYDAYKNGYTPKQIMLELGIDPEIIGEKRLEGIRYHTCRQMERIMDSEPKHTGRARLLLQQEATNDAIKRLEHELAYTRQEVEFLKKLQMANMEAQKQWESKHRPE